MEAAIIRVKTKMKMMMMPVMMLMSVILFQCVISVAGAVNHTHIVGGSSGWDLSSNLSLWSSSTSFSVNDSLVFNYTPDHDVIEVSKSDFATCRINSPISTYDYDDERGQTVVVLTQPGWRYFVCGRPHHCSQGLKLSVQVLNQPNNTTSNDTETQPSHPDPTTAENAGSNGTLTVPKHGPRSSDGYSYHNAVTFGRCFLHLSISLMAMVCIFLPAGSLLQLGGV